MSYYWPIASGQAKEVINSNDLYGASSMTFVSDRFGNMDSAFFLNSGYYQAPSGFYFNNTFSILAWVKLKSYISAQRLLDFGNGANNDNVLVSLSGSTKKMYFHIYVSSVKYVLDSKIILALNYWHHVGFTAQPGLMSIYVNGTYDVSLNASAQIVKITNRTLNYFGKSSWADPNAQAEYDDLKFFNRVLSQNEIMDEFLYGKP